MSKEILPLSLVRPGKEVILVSIEGGWGFRRRLTEMGLKEGMKFKLLHLHKPGPSIIVVADTRLVLGYGMAHKILVKESQDA
ncbi:MAG: ferrous iron transport protein A [Candidatus Omnitrophica bacterium]|nr:ferrous iron transport protein A [Candidatus Omnitrophota bacterium]